MKTIAVILLVALCAVVAAQPVSTPATLTMALVTRLSSIASITYVPCLVEVQAHGATWQSATGTASATMPLCNKIRDGDRWTRLVASTSWDIGLMPDHAATSSVVITISEPRR